MRSAVLALTLFAGPAFAQDPHAHHQAPPAADPHAGHQMPAAADPHAGHHMPPAADPHAGHQMPTPADPHAGHRAPNAPAPATPTDHAADRVFGPAAMQVGRAHLLAEHGNIRWRKVTLETAEARLGDGESGYAWEVGASFGGDINRLKLKTEGDSEGGEIHEAELQALFGRAIDPYFDLELGLRQDVEPRGQTYAVLGIEGVAPYWFEVGAAAFLSDRGDLSARVEASYDLRLTQRLILEPTLELNLAAQDDPDLEISAGLSELEAGLRLRFDVTPRVGPYIGVLHQRRFGDHEEDDTTLVVGLRGWF